MTCLANLITNITVSSVLNRDIKQFGKKHLLDGNDDTCWNSDQGEQQHINLKFSAMVNIEVIQLQFQGGFSCKQLELISDNEIKQSFFPEDVNTVQEFKVSEVLVLDQLKVKLIKPTDFFGRVILYHMKILGTPNCFQ